MSTGLKFVLKLPMYYYHQLCQDSSEPWCFEKCMLCIHHWDEWARRLYITEKAGSSKFGIWGLETLSNSKIGFAHFNVWEIVFDIICSLGLSRLFSFSNSSSKWIKLPVNTPSCCLRHKFCTFNSTTKCWLISLKKHMLLLFCSYAFLCGISSASLFKPDQIKYSFHVPVRRILAYAEINIIKSGGTWKRIRKVKQVLSQEGRAKVYLQSFSENFSFGDAFKDS